jgi:hypothetical protein
MAVCDAVLLAKGVIFGEHNGWRWCCGRAVCIHRDDVGESRQHGVVGSR